MAAISVPRYAARDTDARITVHPVTSTEQCDIADLFGKVQLDPEHDYKPLRQAASVPPR
jgi:hypothetical protein